MKLTDEHIEQFDGLMKSCETSINHNVLFRTDELAMGTVYATILHPTFELIGNMVYYSTDAMEKGVSDHIAIVVTVSQDGKEDTDVTYDDVLFGEPGRSMYRMQQYLEAVVMEAVLCEVLGIIIDEFEDDDNDAQLSAAWN